MTKFIVGLSLMVVVLAIGCFTFPLDESSTSTRSPLVTRSFLPDQEKADLMESRSFTDGMDLETSTYFASPKSPKLVNQKTRKFGESESSELFPSTTINSFHARGFPVSSMTSAEATTELIHNVRSVPEEKENETENESETDKREVFESTTSYMPSFTSTSSAVAPNYYKSESSTQKYVGRLDETSEEGSEPSKMKKLPESELELTTEMNYPIAHPLDPKQADQAPNLPPNGIMYIEENAMAVTNTPKKFETMEKPKENSNEEDLKPTPKSKLGRKPESEESLNQGKEPSFTEAPQPDN